MTIDILIEALEMLRDRGDNPDYKRMVIRNSIDELYNLKDSEDECIEHWNGAVHVIHTQDFIDLMNTSTYDTFGRAMHAHCGDLPFPVYRDLAKNKFGLHLSIEAARTAYEVLGDLWHDNEVYGNHNEDGTYKSCNN